MMGHYIGIPEIFVAGGREITGGCLARNGGFAAIIEEIR